MSSVAFSPAARIESEAFYAQHCNLISDQEAAQRRHILSGNTTPFPDPPRSKKWKWYTVNQYRLNDAGELEYIDEKKEKEWRKVVSLSGVYNLIVHIHCVVLPHVGMDKTEAHISRWYKGISRQAIRFTLERCQACSVRAVKKNRNPVQPIITGEVFEHVQIDLVDMSYKPCDYLGQPMKWICHIKDHFSKFSQIYPLPNKTATAVQGALIQWIMAFGPPKTLQSDNGTEFCNSLITKLAEEHGFKLAHGRPYHPQAQGLVEQGNGVIGSRISKWRADTQRDDWVSALPHILRSINYSSHTALPLRQTPAYVVFGRNTRFAVMTGLGSGSVGEDPSQPDLAPEESTVQEAGEDGDERSWHLDEEVGNNNEDDWLLQVTTDLTPEDNGLATTIIHDSMPAATPDAQSRSATPDGQSLTLPLAPGLSVPSPQRRCIVKEVQAKGKQKRAEIEQRWGDSGKTTQYSRGSHVTLHIPPALRHGIDQSRIRCLVLEAIRPGYYRLLCEEGILEGTHRPGDLHTLVGHRFSAAMMETFKTYKRGTKGEVTISHIAAKLSSESVMPATRVPAIDHAPATFRHTCRSSLDFGHRRSDLGG